MLIVYFCIKYIYSKVYLVIMNTKYAKDHKKIKDAVALMQKETEGSSCVIVSELAKETKIDPRTLRKHLEVMEIDGYGSFSEQKKKHIFCIERRSENE